MDGLEGGISHASAGCGPADGIRDHPADLSLVVDGVLLIAWAEVEDSTASSSEAASTAKDLASRERAYEDQLVGRRHVEEFAVRLLARDRKYIRHAVRDGVGRGHRPYQLSLAGVAPAQRARGAHQLPEHPGVVARVQYHQAHAAPHPVAHPSNNVVRDVVVGGVPPPGQHVRRAQHDVPQALPRLVQGCGAYGDVRAGLLANPLRDRLVHTLRVNGRDLGISALMDILAPHRHAHDPVLPHSAPGHLILAVCCGCSRWAWASPAGTGSRACCPGCRRLSWRAASMWTRLPCTWPSSMPASRRSVASPLWGTRWRRPTPTRCWLPRPCPVTCRWPARPSRPAGTCLSRSPSQQPPPRRLSSSPSLSVAASS